MDSTEYYDTAEIRDLLCRAFTADDLRRFCQDRPSLRPVCDRFGSGASLLSMADEIIQYCQNRLLFDVLLDEVRQQSPRQYEKYWEKLEEKLRKKAGPQQGTSEIERIKELVRQHNAAYAQAFSNRDPRRLWETCTSETYFSEVEPRLRELLASSERLGIVAVEDRHILFQDIKLTDLDCAIVKTLETWEYIYGSGEVVERKVPNTYTLEKRAGRWSIAHNEMAEA